MTKLFKTQSVQIVAGTFLQLKLNLFLITQAWTKIIHLEKTMLELKNVRIRISHWLYFYLPWASSLL